MFQFNNYCLKLNLKCYTYIISHNASTQKLYYYLFTFIFYFHFNQLNDKLFFIFHDIVVIYHDFFFLSHLCLLFSGCYCYKRIECDLTLDKLHSYSIFSCSRINRLPMKMSRTDLSLTLKRSKYTFNQI